MSWRKPLDRTRDAILSHIVWSYCQGEKKEEHIVSSSLAHCSVYHIRAPCTTTDHPD